MDAGIVTLELNHVSWNAKKVLFELVESENNVHVTIMMKIAL